MKIAIMQPAFLPPASYLRLFAAVDMFVMLDDVQFNRRWYTHRQKLTKPDGTKDWLTLPIKKTSRNHTRIMDMQWAENATYLLLKQMERFSTKSTQGLENFLTIKPVEFIENTIKEVIDILGIKTKIVRSSDLSVSPCFRGTEKLIAICKGLEADGYINSPGGKYLYDPLYFAYRGITLTFLPEYNGSMDSIVDRLALEKPADVYKEIMENI